MGPFYRLWQFFSSVRALFSPPDDAEAKHLLSPSEYALFRKMARYDRAHCLRVMRNLRGSSDTDPSLLRAALLHDVGKSAGPERIPLLYRGPIVLARRWAGLWTWLTRPRPPGDWRRPFLLYATHAERGAGLANAAGSPEDVVELIAAHHDDEAQGPVQLLQKADRQS